jgi:CRISPR type IV-associated protein Csf3
MKRPLKITFTFKRAIQQPDYPMHLDGVIGFAVAEEAAEQGVEDVNRVVDTALPFGFEEKEGLRVWQASTIRFEVLDNYIQHAIRTTSKEDISDAKRDGLVRFTGEFIKSDSGAQRAFMLVRPMQLMAKGVAYCVGDQERIESLLQRIKYLGASRKNGYGMIDTITVEADEAANDRWMERVMLWPTEKAAMPIQFPCSPPYWDRRSARVCYVDPVIFDNCSMG